MNRAWMLFVLLSFASPRVALAQDDASDARPEVAPDTSLADREAHAAGCARSDIDASGAPGLVTGTNVLLVSAIVAGLCGVTAWTLFAVDVPTSSSTALRLGPGTLALTF